MTATDLIVPAHAVQAAGTRPVLVIIGPSGSGKSSVVRTLFDWGLVRVHPTWTTRPRRSDEQAGSLEHRFVSEAGFDRLDAAGFFCDTVTMFGLPHRYGLGHIERASDGPIDLVMLRVPLVERLRRLVPELLVYQVEDGSTRTRLRLEARDCPVAETLARLAGSEQERVDGREVADRVFRNDRSVDSLALELVGALAADLSSVTDRAAAR